MTRSKPDPSSPSSLSSPSLRPTEAPSKVSRCPAFFACLAAILSLSLLFAGCSTLDERQRAWIFQPSDKNWGVADSALQEVWIDFHSGATGRATRLNGLWLAAEPVEKAAPQTQLSLATTVRTAFKTPLINARTTSGDATRATAGPVLLYLHGARWNVSGSIFRMRRMQELGFSVLGVDYRGFGKSSAELPSEQMAYEDARAAWDWLAARYPDRPRYIFGHSLGGPIAIHLASEVEDESGTMVEGTFSSMADVVSSFKWGWMPLPPVGPLLTQRFEAVRKVGRIGSPLLVVHGGQDQLIQPRLGKKLFDAAAEPKRFVLVENGSHHNTNSVGQGQYRQAIADLFGLPAHNAAHHAAHNIKPSPAQPTRPAPRDPEESARLTLGASPKGIS